MSAPRTLKEPVRCRFSSFSQTSAPLERPSAAERWSGVRSTCGAIVRQEEAVRDLEYRTAEAVVEAYHAVVRAHERLAELRGSSPLAEPSFRLMVAVSVTMSKPLPWVRCTLPVRFRISSSRL